ncbi:MAG: NAD(P)/FAD-dependent oxidoreductase [Solirubrobacteraceae bacterium]
MLLAGRAARQRADRDLAAGRAPAYSRRTFDAIVIGARCAGAATAMVLARAGHSVLLVDRAAIGSDIPHGHFIHRHGPRRLADWGLLEPLLADGCPPATTMATDFGDGWLTGRDLVVDGVPAGLGPRRSRLDRMLAEAAAAAGAEVRDRLVVDDVLERDGRVAGIRGREVGSGRPVVERARVVVGADGRGSTLARLVGAPVRVLEPTVSCWYFSYWGGVPSTGLEIVLRPGCVVFAFPTNDDLLALFVAWPVSELATVRADIEGRMLAALDAAPDLAERVRGGTRAERLYGASHLPNHLRAGWGPGWALVGDAGCHKDPFLALGVCDALRDAELLARALDAGLADDDLLDDALAGYEPRRDEATLADFHANLAQARLGPVPDEVIHMRAAVRGDQDATNRFYLGSEGRAGDGAPTPPGGPGGRPAAVPPPAPAGP